MRENELLDPDIYVNKVERGEIDDLSLIYNDGRIREEHRKGDEEDLREFLTEMLSRRYDHEDWIQDVISEIIHRETHDAEIPSSVTTDIQAEKNGYWEYTRNQDGTTSSKQVTNFHLETTAFVIDEDGNEYVDITVIPCEDGEEPYNEIVDWTVFNEKRKFQDSVVTGRTTTFLGKTHHLNDLRLIVAHQDAPTLRRTTKLGLQDGQIVTGDQILGTDSPSLIYDRKPNTMSRKFQLESLEFDRDEVRKILEQVPEIRENKERLLAILGWWFGALQTPRIREVEGEVAQLGVFGGTGAGKTTVISALERLIGLSGDALSPHTTNFSLMLAFSSATNIPLWIDEYKPSEIPDSKLNSLHNMMRIATKGSYDARGNADQSENSYLLENPVLVSGEQSITRSAESRRLIQIRLKKSGRDPDALAELNQLDVSKAAPAIWAYTHSLGDEQDNMSGKFEDMWRDAKEFVKSFEAEETIEDLTVTGLAQIKLGLDMYRDIAEQINADPNITEDEIEETIRYILDGTAGTHISHIEEFLRLLSTAAREGEATEGQAFHLANKKSGKDEKLYIRLDSAHAAVRRYVKDHDINEDVFDNYTDYRDRFVEMSVENGWIEDTSRPYTGLGRCIVLHLDQTEEAIEGFEGSAFYQSE